MVNATSTCCFKVGDELLTPAQLAELLHVPQSWIYEQTRERSKTRADVNGEPLPCVRLGKYLRFCWADVVDWLNRRNKAA
jgi:hypothetical protein